MLKRNITGGEFEHSKLSNFSDFPNKFSHTIIVGLFYMLGNIINLRKEINNAINKKKYFTYYNQWIVIDYFDMRIILLNYNLIYYREAITS